jgi:transposase
MLGMDQVFVVRHKVLVEGRSARDVARELGISRNTVRRYVEGAEPVRTSPQRERPVLEAVRGRIDALLEDSPRWTGGKQRLTATQLHRMMVAEGHQVGVTLVKECVAEWRSSPDLCVKRTHGEAPRLLHAALASAASFIFSSDMSR